GDAATTTDANLALGRINPHYFCGGEVEADLAAVDRVLAPLAGALGVDPVEVARGIVRVANNNMVNALKLVSVNRGYDPRDFTLVAFGGGEGLHAAALARERNIPKVVIPAHAAVCSAWGMLMSDLRREWVLTRPTPLTPDAMVEIDRNVQDLKRSAIAAFEADGYEPPDLRFECLAHMRDERQEHTVAVPLPAGRL